ncbi:ribonuclease 3 [Manduca sexta]|uniref:ribonuclease 3 n=1 Tax=Manduca sexta TaxID=7130 RepID=UPI00188FB4D0|nr:ribonuclease 3 [Manduca sexta]
MSIPPINYSVPPPSLNMPPPVSPHHVSPATSNPNFYNHPPPLYHMPALQHADQSPYVAMASLPQFDVPPHVYPAYSDPLDVSQPTPHYYPPPVSNEYMYQNPEDYKNQDPQWYNSSGIDNGDLMAAPSTSKCIPRINERSSSTERYRYQYSSKEYLSKHRYSPGRSHSYEYRDYRDHDRYRDREREFDGEGRRDRYREIERERRRDRDREMERDRSRDYRYRSRSPTYHSHHGRSPSRSSTRDREAYYREKESKEKEEYERRRYEYERYRSMSRYSSYRSHSRSCDSRASVRPRRSRSRNKRSCSRESYRPSRTREMSHYSHKNVPPKPMSDREKILEEYRKNYCQTSEDFIQKMEQWSKEHSVEEEEGPKMWYRSSPAELYYKPVEGGTGVQQTSKLEKLCEKFYTKLIERGRNARPEVDELPPLKTPKAKTCMHTNSQDDKKMTSSSSYLDEEGFEGFTDRIMLELQRKQSHPRRLHPEMWFNSTGEMNGGPLCRCSAKARRYGMRHGVYAGEETFPKCNPLQNNIDKLYHYRITVSPPTNFLIKAPTIIGHDEHEFLFSGFSMFSHYKLAKLPMCKVIRFNIEYTILYVEEPAPQNFTIKELDLFEEFLFYELLELVDLDLGKATDTTCSQFHFLPRFVRYLPEGGCEVLSMCEVIKYLIDESGLLIPPETLSDVHEMDHYTWQKFVDRIKGMIVTYPGKKPCSVRVDQLDRSPPTGESKHTKETKKFYPEIVHFGIRPPQLSYAGNPEYQRAWRYYVKYRHLIANMAKPSFNERQKLAAKEAQLQEIRMQNKMKRDVTVAMSSEGFHTTGLMCDVVQHAMLIPVLVRHLRFHKSLNTLEEKIGYVFKQRALLQTALTHPSYRENFGTNPDHARNSLTNCGIRQPEYGDRRIHYTRKKGIVTLINIMSRFGKNRETESEMKHNERLEFLGDAVVEFLSSIHLFKMFPGLAEGGLATYRAAIVQNQHLAQLARNIELEQFMLYAHGSDLCRDVVMRHAMANSFEALMGALFLDAGLQVADRVFSLALWYNEPMLHEAWTKERLHPLQEQEPLGDRKYIKDFEFLQRLTEFEDSIGVQFKHIRLLARAFTDRSVGFTHLTLGSNQRLEFLGDTVLQLVVSDRLYRHFPDHHEGHLSLLRSSLVNNRTQSMVCDDLNMSAYAIYNNPKAKPTTKKHKADLLEAFLGALFIDKNLEYCQAFCNACLFPRLQEFIMNQDWNDPKSKLQQCCLTLRSVEGGEPDIPVYKVIECLGPTNTRVYTVGVYFRGARLAAARGHSIQEAEMNAAEQALNSSHELFPQLDHQKRLIAKSLKKKNRRGKGHESPNSERSALKRKRLEEKVPKAYRLDKQDEQSEESSEHELSQDEAKSVGNGDSSDEDSGLDSDTKSVSYEELENVQVSSLLSDMEKMKEDFIRRNEYEKLKEKCRRSDSDDD